MRSRSTNFILQTRIHIFDTGYKYIYFLLDIGKIFNVPNIDALIMSLSTEFTKNWYEILRILIDFNSMYFDHSSKLHFKNNFM